IDRMGGCIVTVDGQECYTIPNNVNNRQIRFSCSGGIINGRKVKVTKHSKPATLSSTLIMCEVQIWSCSDRYWGSGCNHVCGECGDGAPCDKVTGHCDSGCQQPGVEPPLCTQ
ncbi:hypothetical protein BaRGS_00012071, partial [Batillaria attramentaria]